MNLIQYGLFKFSLRQRGLGRIDLLLIGITCTLILLGLVMVTSASMPLSMRLHGTSYFFTIKTLFNLLIGIGVAGIVFLFPIRFWHNNSLLLFLSAILLLLAVLIGHHQVKGAARWLSLAGYKFQPSELAKLALFCVLSNYLAKQWQVLSKTWLMLLLPIGFSLILVVLLLLQPDLGSAVVLLTVTFGVLFLAGAARYKLLIIALIGLTGIVAALWFEAYRWRRIIAFLDPWGDPYNSGYQLVNSLIAIGYGGATGQGLGNSILKQGYLPEVYTDFIFSIIAEELGYVGALLTVGLLFVLVLRILWIGLFALQLGQYFAGFLACQIGMGFGIQILINLGMTMGLLPTKGLTLPFISYGGSSLLLAIVMVTVVLRIDYEMKKREVG